METTKHGSYEELETFYAACKVNKDAQIYQLYLERGVDLSRSLTPGINTAATLVSAFCGVAGLTGHKSDSGEIEINIMNNTPYALAPATVYSKDFGFQEAARLMPSGESTTLKGCTASGFKENTSYIRIGFVIGDSGSESIELALKIACGDGMRWQITEYTIDDKSDSFPYQSDDECNLQYLAFHANDINLPSFSVHLLPARIKMEGKINLIFYPTNKNS